MTAANRDACIDLILALEGGYVDHPSDPGGATNMGVTHKTLASWRGRAVSKSDVRELDRAEAAAIYRDRYWNAVNGDRLPPGLDLVAFDAAVHSGPVRGAAFLQKALRVGADGVVGPQTIDAAERSHGPTVIAAACAHRLSMLRSLKHWRDFGKGWAKRVARVEARATAMWASAYDAHVGPLLEYEAERSRHDARATTNESAAAVAGAAAAEAMALPTAVAAPTWATVGLVAAGAAVAALALIWCFRRRAELAARADAFVSEARRRAAETFDFPPPPSPAL